MPTRALPTLAALLAFIVSPLSAADGVIVGADLNDGPVLLTELNCVACHAAPADGDSLRSRQAPILADVGKRITPQYLRAFLADPQKIKPGSPMPDLLHALPADERPQAVEDLVHYLSSLGGSIDALAGSASKNQVRVGGELFHTVGCVACHDPVNPPPKHKTDPALVDDDTPKPSKPEKPSFPLGNLALKTTLDPLAAFLSDPLTVRPSGRMPSLHLHPGEARAIAAHLLREQQTERYQRVAGIEVESFAGRWDRLPDFDTLTPKRHDVTRAIDLNAVLPREANAEAGSVAVRFHGLIEVTKPGVHQFRVRCQGAAALSVNGQRIVDLDGIGKNRQKDGPMDLPPGKHALEILCLNGAPTSELTVSWQPPGEKMATIPAGALSRTVHAMVPKGQADFRPEPARRERGKQLFTKLGCASCHSLDRNPPPESARLKAPELPKLTGEGGCLAPGPEAGRPRFALSEEQRKALQTALGEVRKWKEPRAAQHKVEHAMSALNCFACHARKEKGGPDRFRADYFTYEVVADLGDEGRLPPPLNDIGANLTAAGFEDALFSGMRYRTTMATRMPNFGKDNIGHLPGWFAQADAGKVANHRPNFSPKFVDEGRRLVGKDNLTCINCHAWGGMRVSGAEGLDLQQAPRRLQPGWFHAFLLDPARLKPRTRMPTAFPEGKSILKEVLDGDADAQIDAMWAYLSAGSKGGYPAGLSPNDNSLLVPGDEPIVFRTFLNGVSAHSILVGFRQRTHLAFDANRVRTAVAWSGDFISTKAAWDGRAGQYAPIPGADVVRFPESPPFARLESRAAPWPSDVPKGKEGSTRTPEGWQYLGYRFDEKRNPVFRYRVGVVEVEEAPATDYRPDGSYLARRFRLKASEDVSGLYFLAAAGKSIEARSEEYVVEGRFRYRVRAGEQPFVRDAAGGKQLLVPLVFDDKTREANLAVELSWTAGPRLPDR